MKKVWWANDSIFSPLGKTSEENFNAVALGKTGISVNNTLTDRPVHVAKFTQGEIQTTKFEWICEVTLKQLFSQNEIPKNKILFILSTTKGNIELLENEKQHSRIHLHEVGNYLAKKFGWVDTIVVSNACTSGVAALIFAKRQIESGAYDHAVVLGADAVSRFIVTGFQSLNALSDSSCKPFDIKRNGINLGEAASAVFLTNDSSRISSEKKISIGGGAISNDANHISGPSKTGEELAYAINQTLKNAQISNSNVDFISAHGTATLYNDEMESKAFYLAGLSETPLHSLKGSFGHTLGAAGVLESILSVRSLYYQKLLPTTGFESLGVSKPLNIIRKNENRGMTFALKTSSGFGGCNASILFKLES